jgi:hypothetical protein
VPCCTALRYPRPVHVQRQTLGRPSLMTVYKVVQYRRELLWGGLFLGGVALIGVAWAFKRRQR